MSVITQGHLSNNGGIRGHSAGDFYPWRIMSKGTPDNLTHYVVNPEGKEIAGYPTAKQACERARREFNKPVGA